MNKKFFLILIVFCLILFSETACTRSESYNFSKKTIDESKINNEKISSTSIDDLKFFKGKIKEIELNSETTKRLKESLKNDLNNAKKILSQIYNENRTIKTWVAKALNKIKELEAKILESDKEDKIIQSKLVLAKKTKDLQEMTKLYNEVVKLQQEQSSFIANLTSELKDTIAPLTKITNSN